MTLDEAILKAIENKLIDNCRRPSEINMEKVKDKVIKKIAQLAVSMMSDDDIEEAEEEPDWLKD